MVKGPSDFCFYLIGHLSAVRGPGKGGLSEGLPRRKWLWATTEEAVLSLRVGLSGSAEPGPFFGACGSPWHPKQIVVRGILGDRCPGAQAPAE